MLYHIKWYATLSNLKVDNIMHQEICIVNRGYFEYSTCRKCLFVDTGRITTLVKENPRLRFFTVGCFLLK